jgi:hypothetical protein
MLHMCFRRRLTKNSRNGDIVVLVESQRFSGINYFDSVNMKVLVDLSWIFGRMVYMACTLYMTVPSSIYSILTYSLEDVQAAVSDSG